MEENRNEQSGRNQTQAGGMGPEASKSIFTEYIMEEKDTLPVIAEKYGVSVEEILEANRDTVRNESELVRPGTKIMIPNKRN